MVLAAAIVTSAVLLGVYYAFASDVRTRGAVVIARIETLGRMAAAERSGDETLAERTTALAAAMAATDAAEKALAAGEERRAVLEGRLEACHEAEKSGQTALALEREATRKAELIDLQRQLDAYRSANGPPKQTGEPAAGESVDEIASEIAAFVRRILA